MAHKHLTILQLLPALESGGVERGTVEIARAVVAAGHRSLVMSAGGRYVEQLIAEGSEHLEWDIGRKHLATLLLIRPLRRLLIRERVDIVHVRSRLPAWILDLALRGIPPAQRPARVSTVHGLYSVSRYSAIMTRGERIIAVSNTVRDYILQNYPECLPSRIVVIPRGADPREFPHDYRPEAGWKECFFDEYPHARDKILLTLPGRLTRLKGHHEFISLIDNLIQRGHAVHGLLVGGEDPRRLTYARELREAVTHRKLEDHITFTGARTDIREVYAISTIVYSLSTKPESFGRTVVEALSMGVPVIGYDHGGVGEVLDTLYPIGKTPLGNSRALFEKTVKLLSKAPQPLSNPAYQLAVMTGETLALYIELAECRIT